MKQVVAGVAEGCVGQALPSSVGKRLEMPGMYGEDDHDLAGFMVGVAENLKSLTAQRWQKEIFSRACFKRDPFQWLLLARRVFADYTGEEVLPELVR